MATKITRDTPEQNVARRLLSFLIAGGFRVSFVDYGDGEASNISGDQIAALDLIFGVDEALVGFTNNVGRYAGSVYLVFGNAPDGSELIADYSWRANSTQGIRFMEAVDEFCSRSGQFL